MRCTGLSFRAFVINCGENFLDSFDVTRVISFEESPHLGLVICSSVIGVIIKANIAV